MSQIIIGIGEIAVTNKNDTTIKTYALGSCIALIIHDKNNNIGGMAHIALSNSNINIERSKNKPGYFVDTGIRELFSQMEKYNFKLNYNNLSVYLIGGASVYGEKDFFKIGENNIKITKRILKDLGITISKEETGKHFSRTVEFDMPNNKVIVSNQKLGKWEL